jgi:hypothetical protein
VNLKYIFVLSAKFVKYWLSHLTTCGAFENGTPLRDLSPNIIFSYTEIS